MRLVVGSGYIQSTTMVADHLANKDSSSFVLVNTQSKINNIIKSVKTNIDSYSTVVANVLRITGGTKTPAKYAHIGIFTGKCVLDKVDARIMGATAVSDLGVDHPHSQLIINCE
jgi:hypothetical protein